MARILLIRHGPSAQPTMPGLLDFAGVERWRAAYDAAGIAPDATPPVELLAQVARVARVVASDLPRAVASAACLSQGQSIETTPLLREVPLTIPALAGVRAPLAVWNVLFTLRWGLDIVRRQDCPASVAERVSAAAEWCEEQRCAVGAIATLAVVTHGVMRRLLARRLCNGGWTLHGLRGYAPWSLWELTKVGFSA
jgi:broad specificity phosphatase PhoE